MAESNGDMGKGSARRAASPRRPNVVFILTDDQNFDTLGCYGARVMTPHQDRLAAEGVRFNRAYVTTAACMPSRYGCLTGHYPSRCRHPRFTGAFPPGTQTSVGFNTPLSADLASLPHLLRQAGYTTGMVGKWHLGETGMEGVGFDRSFPADTDPRDPDFSRMLARHQELCAEQVRARGFDTASRIYWNNPASYGVKALDSHNMEWVTEGALDFIETSKDNPFFLLMAPTLHHVPHPQASLRADPRVCVGGYLDRVPDVMPPRREILPRVKAAGFSPAVAYCTYLDDGVGAVLDRLDALGLAEDTVVLLLSDNNVPDKLTLYEGGIHVPMLIRWPRGIAPAQVRDDLVLNLDIAPTLLDVCGIRPPEEMRLDGASLLPMLQGSGSPPHDALFFESGSTRAMCTRDDKYLALRYPAPPKTREDRFHGVLLGLQINARLHHPAYFEEDQLYDLHDDPEETTNLVLEDPDRLRAMRKRLRDWLASFGEHPFGEVYLPHGTAGGDGEQQGRREAGGER